MSVLPLQEQPGASSYSVENPLTKEEIEKQIYVLTAEEIEAIAKTLIHKMMDRLKIDVPPIKFTGNAVMDEKGFVIDHKIVQERYEPTVDREQFMKAMLPLVIAEITKAFSTPSEFVTNGIRLNVIGRNSLIDQIAAKQESYRGYLSAISAKLLNALSFTSGYKVHDFALTLRLKEDSTKKYSELYFGVLDSAALHRRDKLKDFKRQSK